MPKNLQHKFNIMCKENKDTHFKSVQKQMDMHIYHINDIKYQIKDI